jgi:hypothetical protein
VATKTVVEAQVKGISALTRDLLKLADDHSSQLLPYLQNAATQAMYPIADATRSALPHLRGRLAGTVRVARNRTGASVREGGINDVVYAGPVDFGGWPPTREYIPTGRYLFPTAESLSAKAEAIYNQAVAKALQNVKWTNDTNDPKAVHD